MLPDWVSNPGPLTYESHALLIALRGPALAEGNIFCDFLFDSFHDVALPNLGKPLKESICS